MWTRLFLCGLSLYSLSGWGATVRLFRSNGQPAPRYAQKLRTLKPGDRLVFSHGESFTLQRFLGGHDSSILFATARGALRLAKNPHDTTLQEIADFHDELVEIGVPVVRIFASVPTEYLLSEELRPDPRLGRLIRLDEFTEGLTEEGSVLYGLLAAKLVEFARGIALYSRVGDQGSSQVLFTDRGWVLADYRKGHVRAKTVQDAIPFAAAPRKAPRCASALSDLEIRRSRCVFVVPPELETAVRLTVLSRRAEVLPFQEDWPLNQPVFRFTPP